MTASARYSVLHCIDTLGVGGAEIQLLRNIEFDPSGRLEHKVHFLREPATLADQISAAGAGISCARVGKSVRGLILGATKLRISFLQKPPDLVHCDGFGGYLVGRLAARFANIPAVTTVGNTLDPKAFRKANPQMSWEKVWLPRLVSVVLSRVASTKFIAISHAVQESVERFWGISSERIEVIHRGIDTSWFQINRALQEEAHRLRESWGIDNAFPVIVLVARLVPQKGVDRAIWAFREVVRDYPNASLLVVGDGPLLKDLRTLAHELGVGRSIVFAGHQVDVRPYYVAGDFSVVSSIYEGFGAVVIEAMALERPVVAFDVGPMPELIVDGVTGGLVKGESPQKMARRIKELGANEQKMRDLGKAARHVAVTRFDIRKR